MPVEANTRRPRMMRRFPPFAIGFAAILFPLALTGGTQEAKAQEANTQEAKREEVLGKLLGSLQQIAKTLEGVTDEATAKSAGPELKKQADEFRQTRKLSEQVPPPPSREAREKIAKDWAPKFVAVRKTLELQIARVQRVDGGNALLAELRTVIEPTEKK
jgi:hypothetical protein